MPSVIATLTVRDDKVEEARKLFAQLAREVRESEPGTLAYIAHQRADQPATFVFYEKYADQAAFEAHGENLKKKGAAFAGVLAGAPEVVMMEEL